MSKTTARIILIVLAVIVYVGGIWIVSLCLGNGGNILFAHGVVIVLGLLVLAGFGIEALLNKAGWLE